jgi:uncharacterized lipoprotein YajG
MKLLAGFAIALSTLIILTGCATNDNTPDIQSVQPTPQQINQTKLQNALQY